VILSRIFEVGVFEFMPNSAPRFVPPHRQGKAKDQRPNANARGYGREWGKLRARYLAANPFCAKCGYDATEVDHKVPLARGGTNDEENLQALCKSCHSKKTRSEN